MTLVIGPFNCSLNSPKTRFNLVYNNKISNEHMKSPKIIISDLPSESLIIGQPDSNNINTIYNIYYNKYY